MKLTVVLNVAFVVSELEDDISALTLRFSPCHSPPKIKTSLQVTREPVSLDKRKF